MEPKVADDLLWGVKAIAKEIGLSERVTYWRLENGQLPAGKSGQIYVASRQALRKHFQELTAKILPPTKCFAPKTDATDTKQHSKVSRKAETKAGTKRAATA